MPVSEKDIGAVYPLLTLSGEANEGNYSLKATMYADEKAKGSLYPLLNGDAKECEYSSNTASDESVAKVKYAVVDPLLSGAEQKQGEVEEIHAVTTHWKDIYVMSIFYFFAYVTYQALNIPLYSYLKKIDPSADVGTLGLITSVFKVVHGVSIALFAMNTFMSRRYRNPLLIGRVVAIIGCVIYLFVEAFPVPARRYVVLVAFNLHAVAEASIIIVRSYVPRISTPADRAAAFGLKNGAVMGSIVAGPLIQMIFSFIPFPTGGLVFIDPWLKLDTYTSTIALILLFNIFALYLVAAHIREPHQMEGEQMDKPVALLPSLRKAWHHLKTLDGSLITMCVVEKCISGAGFTSLFTILNPYITTTFNYTRDMSLLILAVASVFVGLIAVFVAGLFVVAKLGARIHASKTFPISLFLCLIMFLLSYPMPLISSLVPVREGNSTIGCNVVDYAWCENLYMNPKFLWLSMASILIGTSMPLSLISQDTIYSRVLEGADQNIMQAAYVMFEDVALAATPAIATFCFKMWSPTGFWTGCAVMMVVGLALWVPVYGKLRRRGI